MSPRTPTLPPTDPRMWRRALARLHPDSGGCHELFVWGMVVRDLVCRDAPTVSGTTGPETPGEHDRVPYDPAFGFVDEFVTLTMRALSVGQHAEEPYRSVLRLLIDCPADGHGRAAAKQERGATYRQLAAIAHKAGMSKGQRYRWYELARSVPLSEKHASHIIGRLGRRAAA